MRRRRTTLSTTLIGSLLVASAAYGQSAFTYQGRLSNESGAVTGTADLRFHLQDDAGAGIGSLERPNVALDDGVFTVELDFGPDVFSNGPRWLEIDVSSPAGSGPYTTLSPRQPVTAAPLALYAMDAPGGGTRFWSANGNDIYNDNSGRVSIGTTSTPLGKLGIVTSDSINGLHVENTLSSGFSDTAIYGVGTDSGGRFESTSSSESAAAVYGYSLNGFGGFFHGRGHFSGYVGIGTSAPSVPLHVEGTSNIMQELTSDHAAGTWLELENTSNGGRRWGVVSTGSANGEGSGRLLLRNITDGLTAMTIDADGHIDIGALSIVEDTDSVGLSVTQTASNGRCALFQAFGDATRGVSVYTITDDEAISVVNDGNGPAAEFGGDVVIAGGGLGVGTATPSAPLHVQGSANIMQEVSSSHVAGTWIELENTSSGGRRWGVVSTGSANGEGSGRLLLRNITDGLTAVTIDPEGTTHVRVLTISGADLAEKFPVTEEGVEASPGTVMEIDPDNPGQLRTARGSYNRRVAGVVSGAGDIPTGTILGNLPGSEDAPAIALSGRVWVRCDATLAEIELGALLTTSDKLGHAMAVTDFGRAHGAVIGKAMTPLKKGDIGMVLVLVNLQ